MPEPPAQDGLGGPAFAESSTFARRPFVPNPIGVADLAVVGIPWDGLVTFRPGARQGPQGVRQASQLCRSYSLDMDVDLFRQLKVVDAGDVDVVAFNPEGTFARIEKRVGEIQQAGIPVISIGGDHSILLPCFRAVSRKHADLTLIQIDAHPDTSDTEGNPPHHHGTPVRDAIEEGLVAAERVFQIGIRGSFADAEYLEYGRRAGINTLDMRGFHDATIREGFLQRLRETAGGNPCYLSFDVDGVDPAFTPGTGTPVPGGLTSFEAIDLVRRLAGLNFVGGDLVEVAPVYDIPSQITSLFGATMVTQIAALIAIARTQ